MATCASCGQESPDTFRFCPACAAPLDRGAAPAREERKVVTVHPEVLQVFPIGPFDVTVSAAAPLERFVPQPERP